MNKISGVMSTVLIYMIDFWAFVPNCRRCTFCPLIYKMNSKIRHKWKITLKIDLEKNAFLSVDFQA